MLGFDQPLQRPGAGLFNFDIYELTQIIFITFEEDQLVGSGASEPFALLFALDENFHRLTQ